MDGAGKLLRFIKNGPQIRIQHVKYIRNSYLWDFFLNRAPLVGGALFLLFIMEASTNSYFTHFSYAESEFEVHFL